MLFDIPFAFVVGGALGWRAPGRPDVAMGVVGLAVGVPGLAFLQRYPAWDWQYLFDPAEVADLPVYGMLSAAILVAGAAGHSVGRRRPGWVAAGAVGVALYALLSLPRTLYVGDFAAWQSGKAAFLPLDFLVFCTQWFGVAGSILLCAWIVAPRLRALNKFGELRADDV